MRLWFGVHRRAIWCFPMDPLDFEHIPWGINRGPSSQQYWASSPFPSPSQLTWYKAQGNRFLVHIDLDGIRRTIPRCGRKRILFLCCTRTAYVAWLDFETCYTAFISGTSKSFAVVDRSRLRQKGEQAAALDPPYLGRSTPAGSRTCSESPKIELSWGGVSWWAPPCPRNPRA